MIKIGITGGIGSGKTTVCKIFESLGIPVYYSDERAKQLMITDPALKSSIQVHFGEDIYTPDGKLQRKKLADIVFHSKEKLQLLNSLVHPAVLADGDQWVSAQRNVPYTIKEAALLFESGYYTFLDRLITVYAPVELRIERIMARDSSKRKEIEARMANQWNDTQKMELSDWVIYNDGTQLLIPQVMDIHWEILE